MGPPREKQVALSAFALVFSELVQYQMTKIRSSAELETNLEKMGKDIGKRVLDALFYRERLTKRELTEVGILQFITTTCWKALWGKSADSLERSTERDDEYMIVDSAPLVNQFVSVPANLGALDCAAFMAGVVAGLLDGAFFAAQCTAHPRDEGGTVFLIRIGHEDKPEGGDARSDVAALVAALDEQVGAGHAAPPGGGRRAGGVSLVNLWVAGSCKPVLGARKHERPRAVKKACAVAEG